MKEIPIVYATNNQFAKLCAVSIASIIANSSDENMYYIYILHTELDEKNISNLEDLTKRNVTVKCVNIINIVNFENYKGKNLPIESCYRLYATQIIGYPKFIYIDCDTIVNSDIVRLFDEDISDYCIGAVYDYLIKYVYKRDEYNSGVLLINTENFEKEQIREKCFELIKNNDYLWGDQDAINNACKNKIKTLSLKYNYQVHAIQSYKFKKRAKRYYPEIYKKYINKNLLLYTLQQILSLQFQYVVHIMVCFGSMLKIQNITMK